MKNPHGVEPARYMKKGERDAIYCDPENGPVFGKNEDEDEDEDEDENKRIADIFISDNCNKEDSCHVYNNEYESSLYVNTGDSDEENYFSVLDYEVYGIDYENRENINKLCKYPDIIMEYIETKGISDESLKQFDDDTELLTDLDAIHCEDSSIRVKISQLCLKNPSEFLPDTQLVNKQYDSYLREWVGNYKMKLLYRASEHDYTAESFHECCDNQGPTLIIIKSSGGWIFGGYTNQSWSGNRIYNDMT